MTAEIPAIIFADNQVEADWFRNLSTALKGAPYKRIGPRGGNPPAVEDLIRYDRPDIILLSRNEARLVVEKTREVPTGHNVGQRLARLVRAAELQVPAVYFFPFDAKKHGAFSNICNLNIRLLTAMERMAEIHKVPVVAVNWSADRAGELVGPTEANARMRIIVDGFIRSGFDPTHQVFAEQRQFMLDEYERRLAAYPKYGDKPGNSVRSVATSDLLKEVQHLPPGGISSAFQHRGESIVYTMEMTPEKCRREDPYTGMQFIYDYLFCRTGANPAEKSRNLVLAFPKISMKRWFQANPNDPKRKSSNWYLTANALWFRDAFCLLR